MNYCNKSQLFPETLKFKRQFRFLVFCFFWLFLVVPLSNSTGVTTGIVTKGNYILIILLPLWVYNTIFKKGFRYLPVGVRMLLKKITILILIYLFLMALQLVINPHNSSLFSFRRLSVAVISSVSLALLTAFYTLGSQKRQVVMVRVFFIILVFIAAFSTMEIGLDTEENIRATYEVGRKVGIVGQANVYGYFLSLLFIISVAGLTNHIRIISNKTIYIPILLFTFMLILRTGSYGALVLSLMCSIPFLIKTSSIKNILGMYVMIPAFVIVLWTGINIASAGALNYKAKAFMDSISKKSSTSVYEASTFLMRYELIIGGIDKILQKPIFGYGLSEGHAQRFTRNKFIKVHNAFIIESIKGGILVGFVILLFYWIILKSTLQIKGSQGNKIIYSLLLFMFIADNLKTGFNFLSISSGTMALSLLLIFLINNLSLTSDFLTTDKKR